MIKFSIIVIVIATLISSIRFSNKNLKILQAKSLHQWGSIRLRFWTIILFLRRIIWGIQIIDLQHSKYFSNMRVGGRTLSERQLSSILMMLSLCFNQNNQSWNDLWYDGHLVRGNKHDFERELRIRKFHLEILSLAEIIETSKLWRKLLMIIQLITHSFPACFIPGIIA